MNRLDFHWNGPEPLQSKLSCGFERMFVSSAGNNSLLAVFLSDGKGKALRIRSLMQDIAERVEVGVLEFETVTLDAKLEQEINVPASFSGHLKIEKLVIDESGFTIESGIALKNFEGQIITVIAGESPHTLAICVPSMVFNFKPEYQLDRYQHITMD